MSVARSGVCCAIGGTRRRSCSARGRGMARVQGVQGVQGVQAGARIARALKMNIFMDLCRVCRVCRVKTSCACVCERVRVRAAGRRARPLLTLLTLNKMINNKEKMLSRVCRVCKARTTGLLTSSPQRRTNDHDRHRSGMSTS